MKQPELIEWLKEKKFEGGEVPTEFDFIRLLERGVNFVMLHLFWLKRTWSKLSSLISTQKRSECIGSEVEIFTPRNYVHRLISGHILVHYNQTCREPIVATKNEVCTFFNCSLWENFSPVLQWGDDIGGTDEDGMNEYDDVAGLTF